jgi:hypothetical protein
MRILERLFGKSRAKVGPAKLGRGLAEIATSSARPDVLEMLIENLPQKNHGDAFLAMASLNLFAWIRVSQNESLHLGSRASRKKIYDNMASFLVVPYVQLFDPGVDPDATVVLITTNAVELMKIWNDSQDKPPSPQWHIGKEVWFMLEETRTDPDPVRITLLSGLLHTQTMTLLEFVRQIEVSEE